ncbi:CDP-alcohol phosphatidyltransferase family protein [[Eubacterium] cellulosolvens]
MISKIQEKFSVPLNFLSRRLHKSGITPTVLSFLGLFFSLVSALGYFYLHYGGLIRVIVVSFLLLSGLCDALDGALARLYNLTTKLGGIIDSTFDRLGEIAIFSALMVGESVPVYIGVAAMGSSMMVSYIRSRAEIEGISMKGRGVAERPERLLILIGATIFNQFYIGLLLISILSSITILQRMWRVFSVCSKGSK